MDPIGDRYEIIAPLGEGGMAVVDLALDRETGQRVVVKRVLPEFRADAGWQRRLRVEASMLARLAGARVPGLVDLVETDGGPVLVMDRVEGVGFDRVVELVGHDWRLPVGCLADAARALDGIHGRGLVHRDVKPGNLIVDGGGRVVVIDLGIARPIGRRTPAPDDGRESIAGTFPYIPPERLLGRGGAASPLEDVYALGAILHVILTGRGPFESEGSTGRIRRLVRDDPPVVASDLGDDVPAGLGRIARRALARRPEDRYASAAALAEALRLCLRKAHRRARRVAPTFETPSSIGGLVAG